mmetsp:Transcript_52435/g.94173  ORF Transcript_52435/g.94173 Transcript_52435/m.94173 type:complete len:284 (-) Transcript_52435:53-904(-)
MGKQSIASTHCVSIPACSPGEDERILEILQNPNAGVGGNVFKAGFCFGEMLLKRQLALGKHVLELGCGTGYVGLIAAALGSHVTLTDRPPLMPLVKENIVKNGLQDTAKALSLEWGSSVACDHMDTIIMTDCVYQLDRIPSLVQTLEALAPKEIWFANAERGANDEFLSKADHWTWEEVAPPAGNEWVMDVRVFWGLLKTNCTNITPKTRAQKLRQLHSKNFRWCACEDSGDPVPPIALIMAKKTTIGLLAIADTPTKEGDPQIEETGDSNSNSITIESAESK